MNKQSPTELDPFTYPTYSLLQNNLGNLNKQVSSSISWKKRGLGQYFLPLP
jgi:hypothetical protein